MVQVHVGPPSKPLFPHLVRQLSTRAARVPMAQSTHVSGASSGRVSASVRRRVSVAAMGQTVQPSSGLWHVLGTNRNRLAAVRIETITRIECLGSLGHRCELAFCPTKISDLTVDVLEMLLEQFDNMSASLLTMVPKVEDRCDLRQAQARPLGLTNETEAVDGDLFVVPIAACGPIWRREESDLLVVSDRLHRDAGPSP